MAARTLALEISVTHADIHGGVVECAAVLGMRGGTQQFRSGAKIENECAGENGGFGQPREFS
jgi:hypothetical protein